jgi:hypothetical protein
MEKANILFTKVNPMSVSKKFKIKNNTRNIDNAIKMCRSQAELGRRLQDASGIRCYAQKINEWRLRGIVPPYWVRHLASVMGVKPEEIDPTLYG